jgi:hypothetical protein
MSRVKDHMASERIPEELPHDRNFLSRFVVTKTCDDPGSESSQGGLQTAVWEEWIEPLSIHFRHPFSYSSGSNKDLIKSFWRLPKDERKSIVASEYVLLQSPLSFYNNSHINHGLTHTSRYDSGVLFYSLICKMNY